MKLEKLRCSDISHLDIIWSLDWHPSGKILATCSSDRRIKIWKQIQDRWQCINEIKHGHTRTIRRVRFSPSGKFLASCGFDSALTIYATDSFEVIDELDAHQSEVKCVQWSPCETMLATCSRDKDVWIWNVLKEECADNEIYPQFELMEILHGHSQDVKYVAWSDNIKFLASCSYDNDIRLYQFKMEDGNFAFIQTLRGHSSTVWCCQFNSSSNRMVSSSDDRTFIVWKQVPDSSWQISFKSDAANLLHDGTIYSIAFYLNTNIIITASGDNKVRFFTKSTNNFESWEALKSIEYSHSEDVNELRIYSCQQSSNDLIASCSDDGTVIISKINPNELMDTSTI
ncbi:hypothetical protein GJ496_001245 [Pomphorhynchus laevis]|nr:hypothetical protein GJ496_001221 [Pomphorhynchus laevis]KAI0989505.1 hypothetical protein GJ496_001245 [Pomphorhynchus laevis]